MRELRPLRGCIGNPVMMIVNEIEQVALRILAAAIIGLSHSARLEELAEKRDEDLSTIVREAIYHYLRIHNCLPLRLSWKRDLLADH